MLKIRMQWLKGRNKLLMKKWPLVSLTRTTKVKELIVRQCVPCLVSSTPMLIECNQETIVQEEGEASLIASTSNRPASIAALNDASEGMNPLVRDHPVRIMPSYPSFFPLSRLIYARPPVLGTTLNCIIMPHDYYDNTWHVLMVKIPCTGYNS